jgi:hypothetical protein
MVEMVNSNSPIKPNSPEFGRLIAAERMAAATIVIARELVAIVERMAAAVPDIRNNGGE